MKSLNRIGCLGTLALGLGIGAAMASMPGVASAGTLGIDGGAGAAAATGLADITTAVGTAAAITPPTLPDDFANYAISFSGFDLFSLGTASAESSFGNIAIAHGDFADANAMSGFFNYASAEGDHSVAIVGDTGWFDYASAVGDHSSAIAAWGNGNVATATGDSTAAWAGASVVAGVYDSDSNTATAEGTQAFAYAGWDGSSNNVASAIGDHTTDYAPDGGPFAGIDLFDDGAASAAASGGDFWTDLWNLP